VNIYPAIDIRSGRIARLQESAPASWPESEDPVALARAYVAEGVRWLHVVDMDRALGTGMANDELVRQVCGLSGVAVQVGGNIAAFGWARDMIDAGATRVVLGAAAAVEPGRLEELVAQVGVDRAAVALDVRSGALASREHAAPLPIGLPDVITLLRRLGVRTVLHRDLERDGTLGGAELEGAASLAEQGFEVIAAGGVASLEEVARAAQLGLAGVIVGRALLEGRFTLREALACSA
jgi:phosphoribosylformimino-5-aminoimidazole carboxamide ribotide isomerase